MSSRLNELNEEDLLEQKKKLLNQLHPSKKNAFFESSYILFRKNKVAQILKIEKALARLKDYCTKFDH